MFSRLPRLKIGAKSVGFVVLLLLVTAVLVVSAGWQLIASRNAHSALDDARTNLRTMTVLFAASQPDARFAINAEQVSDVRAAAMPTFSDHAIVDRTVQAVGGVATIFVADDKGAFIRRTTNVRTQNGDRPWARRSPPTIRRRRL